MLNDDITQLNNQFSTTLPQDVLDAMQAANEQLRATNLIAEAAEVGDELPEATLLNERSEEVSLRALLAGQPAVITFYRGTWCPYCNLELRAYEQLLTQPEYAQLRVVAISPELPDVTAEAMSSEPLHFSVLSDHGNQLARALGLTFELPENIHEIYLGLGIDVVASQGNEQRILPVPATFIVDGAGKIAHAWLDTNYAVRAEPQDVLGLLKEIV